MRAGKKHHEMATKFFDCLISRPDAEAIRFCD